MMETSACRGCSWEDAPRIRLLPRDEDPIPQRWTISKGWMRPRRIPIRWGNRRSSALYHRIPTSFLRTRTGDQIELESMDAPASPRCAPVSGFSLHANTDFRSRFLTFRSYFFQHTEIGAVLWAIRGFFGLDQVLEINEMRSNRTE